MSRARLAAAVLLVPLWGCEPIDSPHRGQTTILISTTQTGRAVNSFSFTPWISDDGRKVAFRSFASNLVPDVTFSSDHLYVKTRLDNSVELATRNSDNGNTPFDCKPEDPYLSGDGRFLVFTALGALDNASPGNGVTRNVFIRDLQLKITRRAINPAVWPGFGCLDPTISDDGRFVVFQSAFDLGAGLPGMFQTYVSDTSTNPPTIILVSHVPGNPIGHGNGGAGGAVISADGSRICFVSIATNLSPDDPDNKQDVYVATFNSGVVSDPVLVSRASGPSGTKGNGDSSEAHLSPDGLFVAFVTSSTNLGAAGSSNVMVRDLTTNQTTCATVTTDGLGPNLPVAQPRIPRGGTPVVFITAATNLGGNIIGASQPYLSHAGGAIELVAVNDFGVMGNKGGANLSISSSGRWVVWGSNASNLVIPDTNGLDDIFARGPFGR